MKNCETCGFKDWPCYLQNPEIENPYFSDRPGDSIMEDGCMGCPCVEYAEEEIMEGLSLVGPHCQRGIGCSDEPSPELPDDFKIHTITDEDDERYAWPYTWDILKD